jgi:hypothetical protein
MKARFKLPMTEEQAYACLLAAIMAEVEYRHRTFCTNEYLEKRLNEMAHWLTSPSSYFGILLCGGCGNGKSTMLKAFQQLLNSLHIPKLDNDGTYGIQIVDAKYIAYLCKRVFREFLVPCKSTTYASRLLKRHKRETKCTEIVPLLFLGYKGTNFPRNNQKFVGEYNLIAKN